MLFLCYFSVNKGKSSESLLSNKNMSHRYNFIFSGSHIKKVKRNR